MLRKMSRQSPLHRPYVRWKLSRSSAAREAHFSGFWRDNIWGDAESRSGSGSNLAETAVLRVEIPRLLRELGVASLLDVPCGDFTWMQHVDLEGIQYIGGDIVGELVDALNVEHGRPGRRFMRVDLICDVLPTADAILVRDLFLHLPNAKVLEGLSNVRRSGARYLITSHYPASTANPDVDMGHHRFPNLTLAPFSLPAPDRQIEDGLGERADKVMGVWRLPAQR